MAGENDNPCGYLWGLPLEKAERVELSERNYSTIKQKYGIGRKFADELYSIQKKRHAELAPEDFVSFLHSCGIGKPKEMEMFYSITELIRLTKTDAANMRRTARWVRKMQERLEKSRIEIPESERMLAGKRNSFLIPWGAAKVIIDADRSTRQEATKNPMLFRDKLLREKAVDALWRGEKSRGDFLPETTPEIIRDYNGKMSFSETAEKYGLTYEELRGIFHSAKKEGYWLKTMVDSEKDGRIVV